MTKIHILPATPETVAERLADEKAVYVVHDRNVGAFARRIAGRLPGLQGIYSLSASEAEKNIDTVAEWVHGARMALGFIEGEFEAREA